MKILNYFAIYLFIFVMACTMESEITPADVFVKYYGTQDEQRAADFQVNGAGEYVIFGTRKVDDETANDFYMLRADQQGNLINSATLGIEDDEENANNELAYRIKVIDQGYLIVGSTAPLNEALIPGQRLLYWAHLDESFEVVTQVIDTVNGGVGDLEGTDIFYTSGDSVLITGYSDAFENNQSGQPEDGTTKLFVGKWSLDGETGWKKTYGFAGSNDEAKAVFEKPDGNIIVFGVTDEVGSNGEAGQNVVVYQLNRYGTSPVGEVPRYGSDGDDEMNRVIKISGGYAVVGTSFIGNVSNPFIMILDDEARMVSQDNLVFEVDFKEDDPFDGIGLGVTRAANNDFVVVGRVLDYEDENDLAKNNEMMFIRTTQSGQQISGAVKNFGLVAGNDEAISALTLANGSIAVLGTADFGSGVTLITLMKMNADGLIKE
tara:strand:- start:4539 stop:5837 length:1299 start_codon:yes stop_codon:yes gene_type:complete